jgi:glycosyltransferase involved in cell wall biosynthesis
MRPASARTTSEMRILNIISSLDPAGGGPIEGLKQLAMLNRGDADIASLDDPAAPWVTGFPVEVHALGPARLASRFVPYYFAPRFLPWLRAHAQDYDAVIVHGLWQYHGLAAWRALRKSRVPYYVFAHGMLDPWFKRTYPLKHLKKWLYWPWAEYRVLRDAKAVLFTSEEEKLLARQSFWLYRCREEVVGFGTVEIGGNAEVQRRAFLEAFPALHGKRVVLFLSRIHPKKGCDLLLQAFARVASRDAALHLVIAGPDQIGWQTELAASANALGLAGRVTWTGMLSGDVKWGAYRAADVFVLPSHQENFGVVVAEALSCGVPVLLSDKVNIWREVQRAGAGMVAKDDLDGTTSLLRAWLDASAPDRERMRRSAVACFHDNFEMGAAADRLHCLLEAA